MLELTLLNVLSTKEKYKRFSRFVTEKQVERETWTIIKDLETWYENHNDVVWSQFATWFFIAQHPTLKEEKVKIFKEIFEGLTNHVVDKATEESIVESLIRRDTFARIATIAENGVEGQAGATLDEVAEALATYDSEIGKVSVAEALEFTHDIEEIVNSATSGGYTFRLAPLNNIITKKLRLGTLMVVGSRPDVGKTTFLASEATFIATQLQPDKDVIWLNNEEDESLVKLRIIQAALGVQEEVITKSPIRAKEKYVTTVGRWDKIRVYKDVDHIDTAQEILENSNPGLIIVDQLWNMDGFNKIAAGETDRLDRLYARAREWGKHMAPVINVHQLGGAAEGVDYPTMNHFYNTQTVLQAHADIILTIGQQHVPGKELVRYIWTPKNKRGNKTKYEVTIKPDIARYL